ncbi:hypothetical protein C1646_771967 [Rhizophagus diaphanus]|nr:hypothetical protein C1646_771967 [Rhizophagus diaphanus] [Rhizophagus sp. MUCL 43196]
MHTPTNFDQTDRTRTLACYDGASPLTGILSRNDIVAEFNNGMTAILQQSLSGKQPIHFMPTEVIPEEMPLSTFKTRLVNILSNTLKGTSKFGIENISAFPLQGYHIEKKLSSDDLTPIYYYRKVACEERLPLSSWAVLTNYSYTLSENGYLFRVSMGNYSSISDEDYNNPLISSALSDESNVFMICMTVHWKDDPNPLKQICLVDVETAPDPPPDIEVGFNISQYDWRFIVKKAKKLGVLEWMFNQMSLKPSSLEKITKWQYQYNAIKVNDIPFHSKHLKIPGCVAIDVRPCFMKFYSKAEKSSLAFYLNECGLESKLDMPFNHMFKYYRNALKEADATTAKQMREIAEYWMKVSNLLSASAWRKGILTSTISERTETELFPGAYVYPPIKGLENRRPITGLDFASLYLSLIMTYNLSPDKIILSRKHAESPRDKKGLYAIMLEYLYYKWIEVKKRLALLKDKKEDMELVIGLMGKGLSLPEAIEQVLANVEGKKRVSLTKNLYHFINKARYEFMAEYDSICFDYSCLDAEQNALKVYMNTFYGTAGDNFVKSKGFQIKYGDTDSLYLVPPERCFQKCNEAYDNGNGISKEEYWSRMVNVSMEVMEKLRDEVNNFLRKDNGSSYLKMAYEKVLFPVVFTGKKKYYGIPHERKRIMDESMRVNNTHTLHQIVEDMLKGTVKDISQTDLNEIIKTAVWRPDKNNKSVQRFISRMRDRHTREEADAKRLIKRGLTPEPYLYEIPELGERFEYVVVENDSSDKVRDKMEYPEVVRRLDKKIDISYYLKPVVTLCARFINYDERYQPSSEIVLGGLKKFKDGNKVEDNKADDGGIDEDDLDDDEEDEDEMDEDEVSKIRDSLAQKSAERARIYAKKLFDITYADKGERLTNNAYYHSFLNALDKQEESIRLKLSSLLKEISEVNIEYRDSMYKLVTKKRAMSLEQYLTSYCLMSNDKKDDSSGADIDEIIELYS